MRVKPLRTICWYKKDTRTYRTKLFTAMAIVCLVAVGPHLDAATIAYYDEESFQLALDAFTLVNLDAPPFDGFAAPYNVQDSGPGAAFLGVGISSFGANHQVVAGNDFQTVKANRDRLITNGSGFGVGDLVINFTSSVNGIGAWTNLHPSFGGDGGEIIAFNAAQIEIGRVALGQSPATPGGFSGIISDEAIVAAEITCTFNNDFKCGVYDIQFGTLTPVPAPASVTLYSSAIVLLSLFGRRNRKKAAS